MSELKDLAKKNAEDLSREEAARLAYSRSTVSLDDYDPKDLSHEERAKDWNESLMKADEPSVKEPPADPVVPLASAGAEIKADSSKVGDGPANATETSSSKK